MNGEPLSIPVVVTKYEGRLVLLKYVHGQPPPLGIVVVALNPGEFDKFTWMSSMGDHGRIGGRQLLAKGKHDETNDAQRTLLHESGLEAVLNSLPTWPFRMQSASPNASASFADTKTASTTRLDPTGIARNSSSDLWGRKSAAPSLRGHPR